MAPSAMAAAMRRWGWVVLVSFVSAAARPSERPQLVVETEHTREINSIKFSPDGRLALSSGEVVLDRPPRR